MARSLIDESPEAERFLKTACRSWEKFKRFPLEEFIRVRPAVLATSGIDRQNERFATEGLEAMAEQIRRDSMWLMYEHNPLFPPLCRVLAAKCFYAPESDLHFVAGVIGEYDSSQYEPFGRFGLDVDNLPIGGETFPREDEGVQQLTLNYNPHEISPPRFNLSRG
jgi:hypothetical protein